MQAADLLVSPANFSEGADLPLIEEIAARGSQSCRLLDIHADPDHNRSVITFAGPPGDLADGLFAAAATAVDLIDISAHSGVHPRLGSVDVAPFVPYADTPMAVAVGAAVPFARRLVDDLGLPCFLYGAAGSCTL
ncbi:MAG: glutamate formimidoyltransferase, partial [Actinomycetota bacterium]